MKIPRIRLELKDVSKSENYNSYFYYLIITAINEQSSKVISVGQIKKLFFKALGIKIYKG